MIIVALAIFPVLFLVSTTLGAAILGTLLTRDGAQRHKDSELLDLNV